MGQWPTFAELETCLLACTLLYLNLLAVFAYAGLARRHGGGAAHGEDGGSQGVAGEGTEAARLAGRSSAAAMAFAIGLVAASALAAWLVWPQV
ncbi:hypothetical protein [Pseudoxanthomonas wuyuanensis]